MKKEILEQELAGLEVSDEVLNKVYNFINKNEGLLKQGLETDKANLSSDLETANSKIAEYEKTIESLKVKAQGNDEIAKELEVLKKAQKEAEKNAYEVKRQNQINEAIELKIGDRKFVNEYTKEALVNSIKKELDRPENFKGVSEIFDELTKDKDGIFAAEHNMPQIPRMGNTNNGERPTKEQFARMGYTERVQLFEEDPEWYDELTGKNN